MVLVRNWIWIWIWIDLYIIIIRWGARAYHTTFGMRGGYFNMGLNYANQSYVTGNWGLEGKSISSLVLSGGLPYNATFGGQIAINASNPWLNATYYNDKGLVFGGYFGGEGSWQRATYFTATGSLGPTYGMVPLLFQSPFLNFIMQTIFPAQLEKVGNEGIE